MITVNNKFVVLFILSLSIAPAIFLGEGNRNLLLIVVMFIAPIFLLKYLKIDKLKFLLGTKCCVKNPLNIGILTYIVTTQA